MRQEARAAGRGSARRRPVVRRRHLSLVRDATDREPADTLEAVRDRIHDHLRGAGVRLPDRELAELSEEVLAEAVSVAIAWVESA